MITYLLIYVDCHVMIHSSHNFIMSSSNNNVGRKRAPAKNSRNNQQKEKRRRIEESDRNFGEAFGHVDPATALSPSTSGVIDDDDHFGMVDARNVADDEEELENFDVNDDDTEVGFGLADIFDVEEILELARENRNNEKPIDEIEELKNACVAENSKKAYLSSLTLFILYYYQKEKEMLHATWIKSIDTFTYGIKNEKKKELKAKKIIKKLLLKCDHRCPPIRFEKYNAKLFMKYLLSLQDGKKRRLGIASYRNRRSAVFHLFRMYDYKQDDSFKLELATLFRGLKRRVTIEKQQGDGRIQTGKSPLNFSLYRRLNEYMLLEATTESVFGRAFLCVSWNLICRSANTISIHLHHMEWIDDALAIYFAHMKNDQCGERKRDPRHCYANPLDPVVCPILALSMYFAVFSISGHKQTALFPGDSQYNRFSTYLSYILEKHKDEIRKEFGVSTDDIGVHSIRKGAASYVSSGSTCAPPQVATNIRAGWTMGVIQDTYLRYEAAGDQYVGRVVAGLPICSAKFAVMPPQFGNVCEEDLDKFVSLTFPHFPINLQSSARLFLASLLYHHDHLSKKYLKCTHPINLSSFLLSEKLDTFKKAIVVRYAWEDNACIHVVPVQLDDTSQPNLDTSSHPPLESPTQREGMSIQRATGIPAHVCILADMQRVIQSQQLVLTKIQTVIKEEFKNNLSGSFDQYFNCKKMDDWIQSFESRIIKKIDNVECENNSKQSDKFTSPYGGKLFHWGGSFKRVPNGWKFPMKMTLHNAWKRYFLGDVENEICAIRFITGSDLTGEKHGRKFLSKYKTLIGFMITEAKAKKKFFNNPTVAEVDEMYAYVSGSVTSLSNNLRAEQFVWVTHYKYVQQYLAAKKKQTN